MRAVAILAVVLSSLAVQTPARASEFWEEVRHPGLGAFRHHVERAQERLRAGNAERALREADRAIDALAGRCEGHLMRGRALGELGSLEAAAEALASAVDRDATCADAPEHGGPAAEVAARAGQYALADAILARTLRLMRGGPERRALYALHGDVLLALGPDRLAEAIRAYEQVLRHQRSVRAALGLALALRRADRAAEAEVVAREAVTRGRVDALVARLPLPLAEKKARLAVALDVTGDREGARRAWAGASEGPAWRAHARRERERLTPPPAGGRAP
ncbi:MAG: hypothetical protein ACOCV4_02290 [Myxococcota bacterium]